LLEELLEELTDLRSVNIEGVNVALEELCKMFRVSKGVAHFYPSVRHEKLGRGESFVCYDNEEEGRIAMTQRVVTEAMTVARCTVYMTDDAQPWTEEERKRVALLQRTVLTFVSKSRLHRIVEHLTNYDSDGYLNMHYYLSNLEHMANEGKLLHMAAFQFNLKYFHLCG
jgi:hypothetical protein